GVATCQLGDPMPFLVPVESNDGLLQDSSVRLAPERRDKASDKGAHGPRTINSDLCARQRALGWLVEMLRASSRVALPNCRGPLDLARVVAADRSRGGRRRHGAGGRGSEDAKPLDWRRSRRN